MAVIQQVISLLGYRAVLHPECHLGRKTVLLGLNAFLTQKPVFGFLGLGLPAFRAQWAGQRHTRLTALCKGTRRLPARSCP